MRAAQLQLPVFDEITKNLTQLENYIQKAATQQADLVTAGEMFSCPYETSNFPKYAEKEGGRTYQALSDLARRYGVYLSAGSVPELSEDGKVYNTAYVFDRQGRKIAKHRKMHLFDIQVEGGQCFKESDTLTAGDRVTVFDTEFGKMGLCICYDFRFPELARLMVQQGARVILVPAAFNMTTGPAHWEIMFRCRALDNQVYVLGTSPSRDEGSGYTAWGHSLLVSPWGQVLAEAQEKPAMLINDLDLTQVDQIRSQLPLLAHRRLDLYELREKER